VISRTPTDVEARDRARLFEIASLLLTYPDAELHGAVDELRAAVRGITHSGVREDLDLFLDWFGGGRSFDAQMHYVRTFDLRRQSGLYLTYYLHGDTRKRGLALLTLKQRYRARGLRLAAGELPDYLPVVLEFAATVGAGDGEAPLRQHRRGLELLRRSLEDVHSPYAHVLRAIVVALPSMTDEDVEAVRVLAMEGPPVEAVGLAPYGETPCTPVTSGSPA
jgi:nitrate reductase delta subunit